MTELPPDAGPVDRIRPGTRLREWRVERFVARGAFGQVFEGRRSSWNDAEPSRALKVFDPILSSQARATLVSEFDILRRARHPHLIAGEDAFDVEEGPLQGCVVFVLERADADLASELTRRGPPPAAEVARLGAHVADGLASLHHNGHLHGDVKPENILRVGSTWKLGDFGVTSALQGSYALAPGATLEYRPPELSAADAGIRLHRSADIWALGVTLWMAATGQHPFVGADSQLRYAAVLRGDRLPAPQIDPQLAALINERCLDPDPHRRSTAAELSAVLLALSTALQERPRRPAPEPPEPAPAVEHPATPMPESAPAPMMAPSGVPPTTVQRPDARRLGAAVVASLVATTVVVEVCSHAAGRLPFGLAARRLVYLVSSLLCVGSGAAMVARRAPRHSSRHLLPGVVISAMAVLVTATMVLFR